MARLYRYLDSSFPHLDKKNKKRFSKLDPGLIKISGSVHAVHKCSLDQHLCYSLSRKYIEATLYTTCKISRCSQ